MTAEDIIFGGAARIEGVDRAVAMTGEYIDSVVDNANSAYATAVQLLSALHQYASFNPVPVEVQWEDLADPVAAFSIGDAPVKPILNEIIGLPAPIVVGSPPVRPQLADIPDPVIGYDVGERPVRPVLEAIDAPSATFDVGDRPIKPTLDDIPTPPISFDYTEIPYVSVLLDALKAKLINDILNGSTGLSPETEAAIYARESERDTRALNDTLDRIAAKWSESGIALPNGILNADVTWAMIEYQNRYSDKSRKIAEDTEKLAIEHSHFVIEQASKLEDVLTRMNVETNKNKLEAARAILESGIEIFKALISDKMAKVELYKSESQAFESNVKAQASLAELQISLFNAKVQKNVAEAELYKSDAQVFESWVKSISSLAETQIALFNAKVQKNVADADLYKADAQVFEAGVKAMGVGADVNIALYNAQTQGNTAKAEMYKAETQAFESFAKALSTQAEVNISLYNAKSQYNTAKSTVAIKQIEMLIKQVELQATLASDIAKSTAQVAGQLAAGSLSALNAGASVSYDGRDSNSSSESSDFQENITNHYGVYHNYSHEG